jgi:hypothetical protein
VGKRRRRQAPIGSCRMDVEIDPQTGFSSSQLCQCPMRGGLRE